MNPPLILSMTSDPTKVIDHPDSVSLECPTSSTLQRLLVFASDDLPSHCGEYDAENGAAWLNTDTRQFDALKRRVNQNLQLQIIVDGIVASNLSF